MERGKAGRSTGPLWARLAALLALTLLFLPTAVLATPGGSDERGTRIVGGKPVPPGKYPFMVAIFFDGIQPKNQGCGGSLITRDVVLTAAHCLFDENFVPVDVRSLSARVGVTNLNQTGQGQLRRVRSYAVHPGYQAELQTRSGFDVAVLHLSGKTNGISRIKLPKADNLQHEVPGEVYTVAGWGLTVPGDPPPPDSASPILLEANLELESPARCAKEAPFSGERLATVLCAAAPKRDSCRGDSGGPLFRLLNGKTFVQIGIVSFGPSTCEGGDPGFYTRVSNPDIAAFIRANKKKR